MLNQELHKLVASLPPTDKQESEPYTLTPDEEQKAISYAIEQAQKFMAWKMRKVVKTEDEIWHRISLIDWNEKIGRSKVLAQANAMKNQEQWQKAQREADKKREANRLKELSAYWTYGRVYKLMKHNSLHVFGKDLDETPGNLPTIKALCFFISRDDRFATELGFDRLKGLLIRGPSDTGKTHLVRCIEDNALNPINSLSMLDITEKVKEDGKYQIESKGKKIIYLDDVGTEEAMVKHYGTSNLWFKVFIETIYHKTKCFNHLILSTNLNFKEIGEQYGFRVESRMREMFNVVTMIGGGYRNKKSQL
jgi:DNA replication protein DnaC